MTESKIRELSVAREVSRAAAAFVEKTVQIWDLELNSKLDELSTIFQSGANNLVLHPTGGLLIVGDSLWKQKIAAYEVPGGKLIWERGNLQYPSKLKFNQLGSYVLCTGRDNTAVEHLDSMTGITLKVIDDVQNYFEGDYGCDFVVPRGKSSPYILRRGAEEFQIPRMTSATLDVDFAPDCVCFSEAGGLVRCVDYWNGCTRWVFRPEPGSHALQIHYNSTDDSFYAVVWDYDMGRFRRLLRIELVSGEQETVCALKSSNEKFLSKRAELITSDGTVIELSTGRRINRLDFPR